MSIIATTQLPLHCIIDTLSYVFLTYYTVAQQSNKCSRQHLIYKSNQYRFGDAINNMKIAKMNNARRQFLFIYRYLSRGGGNIR